LNRVLLGSTANGVLHDAECDVLTVRISDQAVQDSTL
jgi:nucleotide-binding universal stress UspA family protein